VFSIAALGIYAARGLYADGSFFLYNILLQKNYWDFDKPRAFVQIITQTPVVIGIKFGLTDITKLIYLHSLGLIGIPAIIWFFALIQHLKSRHFWTLLVAFSATYLSSGFFAIGEYNLTYALAAYCFSILLKDKLTHSDSVFIVAAAISLTRSYEAMIFLGPTLFLFAARRLINPESNKIILEKYVLLGLLFLFSSASAISAWSILFPRDPVNLADAGNIFYILKSGFFIFLTLMISAYFLIQIVPCKARAILALIVIASSIYFITERNIWNSPVMNHNFRSLSGLILCSIFLAVFAGEFIKKHALIKIPALKNSTQSEKLVSLSLFLSLAFVSATYSFEFSNWIKNFEIEARKASGWIRIDEVMPFDVEHSDFNWAWTNPSLSITLRGNSAGGILNSKAYSGWEPFKPEAMQENPIGYFSNKNELYIIKGTSNNPRVSVN
jgi:hypothetical protein